MTVHHQQTILHHLSHCKCTDIVNHLTKSFMVCLGQGTTIGLRNITAFSTDSEEELNKAFQT